MTDDPVLTAIAASTNDALPDRLWRFDTAAGNPMADIATAVHKAAAEFTGSHQLLDRSLRRLHERCQRHLSSLASHATLHRPHGMDTDAVSLVQLLERHDANHEALLAAYAMWRRHRPTSRDPQVRHLLAKPYDPTGGILTLTATGDQTWLVTPDPAAAAAFGIRLAGRIIGGLRATEQGCQPTAFTHPEHRHTCLHLVYPLPQVDDEAAACRSLLRWWALRDSATWRGRAPDQLTAAEQSALSA